MISFSTGPPSEFATQSASCRASGKSGSALPMTTSVGVVTSPMTAADRSCPARIIACAAAIRPF
jgi:hypothetical protein